MASKRTEEAVASEVEYPLPAGYENQTVGFARAYAHAKRHGNPDKSALHYAESWAFDFEPTEGEDE